MKIMASNSSVREREETPHTIKSTRSNTLKTTNTISDALKRRAESVVQDKSIDAGARAVIRYGLETNDPWLAELVRRVDAGETIIDDVGFSQAPASGDDSREEKLEALIEMICGAGEEPAAALLVLIAAFEKSTDPKALANTVKHLAFTHCGELNLYGMVDAQIALLEGDLLARNTLAA
jgi:hypothetical protein